MSDPGNPASSMVSRRQILSLGGCGFGALAWAGLRAGRVEAATAPHLPVRARRMIFLFMAGGVSQIDSFDPKPRLTVDDGKAMPFGDLRSLAKSGKSPPQRVMKPLWKFSRRGESGLAVSDLFPAMAGIADDLCVVRSLHTEGIAHGPATLFLHCGATTAIRPSFGAWLDYGLGTENVDLPGFVSLSPSLGNGGPRNHAAAFLPPVHQGTVIGRAGVPAAKGGIRDLEPSLRPWRGPVTGNSRP
jgi:hypothetical protein